MNIGIVGAGIMGRTMAYFLAKNKFNVTLFEKNTLKDPKNCSYAAAGMLAPFSEASYQFPSIVAIGLIAIKIWGDELLTMKRKVYFNASGTLYVATEENISQLRLFEKMLLQMKLDEYFLRVKNQFIENEIDSRMREGIYLPSEANVSAHMLMNALAFECDKYNVNVCDKNIVTKIENKKIIANEKKYQFDYVIDCRGLNAKNELKNLRGVRGEIIHLHAPAVKLKHMIRIFNLSYPIYLIPRPRNSFIVGASCIDCEDKSSISVRTVLELLTNIYCLHKGFAEARILKTITHCRPAFETNLPKIIINSDEKIIHINGLYRHGYIFAPVFAEALLKFFNGKPWDETISHYIFKDSNGNHI